MHACPRCHHLTIIAYARRFVALTLESVPYQPNRCNVLHCEEGDEQCEPEDTAICESCQHETTLKETSIAYDTLYPEPPY